MYKNKIIIYIEYEKYKILYLNTNLFIYYCFLENYFLEDFFLISLHKDLNTIF